MTHCPSCGKIINHGELECAFCGIIFEKWKAREERLLVKPPVKTLSHEGSISPPMEKTIFYKSRLMFVLATVIILLLAIKHFIPNKKSINPQNPDHSLVVKSERFYHPTREKASSVKPIGHPGQEVKNALNRLKSLPWRGRTDYIFPPSNTVPEEIISQTIEFSPPDTWRVFTKKNVRNFISKQIEPKSEEIFTKGNEWYSKDITGQWQKHPGGMGAWQKLFQRAENEIYPLYKSDGIVEKDGKQCALYSYTLNTKVGSSEEKIWITTDNLLPFKKEMTCDKPIASKTIVTYEYPDKLDIHPPIVY